MRQSWLRGPTSPSQSEAGNQLIAVGLDGGVLRLPPVHELGVGLRVVRPALLLEEVLQALTLLSCKEICAEFGLVPSVQCRRTMLFNVCVISIE